ncbi:PIN domain-containing protein [Spirosoma areae]
MTSITLAKKAGLLLDTNLLVLYVVGYYDPKRITQHKRTNKYTPEDFDLLLSFMAQFKQFVITPNILTEVNNLLEGGSYQYGPILSILPQLTRNFIEIYEPSYLVMTDQNKVFIKFGLSDTVSCKVAEENYLILTDDLKLCYYLQNNGFDALNFNHLRSGYLLA